MKKPKNKYTVKELLDYLNRNNILLINGDEIGEVILPEVYEEFIKDDDRDGTIKS